MQDGSAGGFSAGFMARPGGAERFRSGRRLAAADLQCVLLALLAERASHGYELIKRLAERSNGFYEPSPGMVYPSLSVLIDAGHVSVAVEGAKKRYSLTAVGQGYLDAVARVRADAILADLAQIGERMAQVRRVFAGEDDIDRFEPGTLEDLMLARLGIKQALGEARGCRPAQAARIAAILRRATDEIRAVTARTGTARRGGASHEE